MTNPENQTPGGPSLNKTPAGASHTPDWVDSATAPRDPVVNPAPFGGPQGGVPQTDLGRQVAAITDSKKVVAGILGILLGSLGIHKFYLGIQQPAIIMLAVTVGSWVLTIISFGILGLITWIPITAMGIIGLVEGIIYLTKTDEQFRQEYEVGKKPWF